MSKINLYKLNREGRHFIYDFYLKCKKTGDLYRKCKYCAWIGDGSLWNSRNHQISLVKKVIKEVEIINNADDTYMAYELSLLKPSARWIRLMNSIKLALTMEILHPSLIRIVHHQLYSSNPFHHMKWLYTSTFKNVLDSKLM